MNVVYYGYTFGKVTSDENGYIKDIKASRLIYLLNYLDEELNAISLKWEEQFIDILSKHRFENVNGFIFVANDYNTEVNKVTISSLKLLSIAVPLMVIFSVLTCMSTDWITSKPWVGIAGCLTSTLGVAGAFGFLLWLDVPYIDLNISVPFLLLGIGLDDSFVLLASWRRTDNRLSVKERMSITYSEAAVSITITSLTNFISFCVGMTSDIRVIQIYSIYFSLSVIFTYICEITFFGGVLALSGYRESRNLHALFCIPVRREKYKDFTFLKLLFVGIVKESEELERQENGILYFYKML
ncbi:patched domain-containing protein 3-like [Centruroides vittatus]|uniref:patched domain-containing protein 3-like n=1 Tax=Centruroides vittatus TaxID=120091 RepID=UPI00350FC660